MKPYAIAPDLAREIERLSIKFECSLDPVAQSFAKPLKQLIPYRVTPFDIVCSLHAEYHNNDNWADDVVHEVRILAAHARLSPKTHGVIANTLQSLLFSIEDFVAKCAGDATEAIRHAQRRP